MSATNCTVMSTLRDVPRGEEMPDNGLPAAWLSRDSSAFHGWTGTQPIVDESNRNHYGGSRGGPWTPTLPPKRCPRGWTDLSRYPTLLP